MRTLFLSCILLVTGVPAFADDSVEAQAILQKIQTAAQKTNFAGTFVFQQDNELLSSRITHRFEAGDEQEKIEKLDGRPREYIRHNEDILSYLPDTKTLRPETRQAQDMFPAVLAFNGANLGEHYLFKLAEVARVAGIDCRMVVVEPKDLLRYGYRFCAAIPSNLMLQAQTIGLNNKVLEQIAFSNLTIGSIDENSLKTSYTATSDWKTVRGSVAVSTASGWAVKSLPAGFKKIREVRRLINHHFDGSSIKKSTDLHEVLQLVFSDGLATISVFIEPMNGDHRVGVTQEGATLISGHQQGNFWLTIVGEVPLATIKLISDSIEYKLK
ncbi:MucB/RseB C-terminal domain-containing protein [Solimicrobium silvestre]|uniref:Negative regulator of sigma E activity n=1 Tax=Solimicrobium silvestre TaxID=2099400 RepID=A0A2S9GWX6_9BURK|nr:MucB/RseB C-terminal domain-containing protein [Solimicrobium silvestre]PRC92220.1 Negative regulator of sigma E activity [Solimicrobium silvestre]